MDANTKTAAGTPAVPTAARRDQIRRRHSQPTCDCGAAELLDYVEHLEAELVRVTKRLETLEARLSRNPSVARFRPFDESRTGTPDPRGPRDVQ